jgi:hypothetical protein
VIANKRKQTKRSSKEEAKKKGKKRENPIKTL